MGLTPSEGLALFSSALRFAFSWISFCFAGSLAMIGTRSDGTGVVSLKLSANFFKSFNLISLSFRALDWRMVSTFFLCWAAKPLKALATSRSTVAVALGTPAAAAWGEAVRLVDGPATVAGTLGSGVAATLDSVVVGGVETSALEDALEEVFGTAEAAGVLTFSAAGLSGGASCVEMMAGSTGAPLTVDEPVGALLAGGVYLLFDAASGGKSCCRRTPLYLE